jgi:hypothetical protein
MTAHRVNRDLGEAVRLGFAILRNPGTGNTIDLEGKSNAVVFLSAGTYKVPNATAGTELTVIPSGAVTLTNVGGTTLVTLVSGQPAKIIALTASTFRVSTMEPRLPNSKWTTSATATTLTPAAGALTGARTVYFENTADGTLALTTRTAVQLYADIPGAYLGLTFDLVIVNRGNNTITITGGTDVNVVGEATIATLVTRTYQCLFEDNGNGAPALTMTSVNKGTIET